MFMTQFLLKKCCPAGVRIKAIPCAGNVTPCVGITVAYNSIHYLSLTAIKEQGICPGRAAFIVHADNTDICLTLCEGMAPPSAKKDFPLGG